MGTRMNWQFDQHWRFSKNRSYVNLTKAKKKNCANTLLPSNYLTVKFKLIKNIEKQIPNFIRIYAICPNQDARLGAPL